MKFTDSIITEKKDIKSLFKNIDKVADYAGEYVKKVMPFTADTVKFSKAIKGIKNTPGLNDIEDSYATFIYLARELESEIKRYEEAKNKFK